VLRAGITETALDGISAADAERLMAQLGTIKDNVKNALQSLCDQQRKEQHYG